MQTVMFDTVGSFEEAVKAKRASSLQIAGQNVYAANVMHAVAFYHNKNVGNDITKANNALKTEEEKMRRLIGDGLMTIRGKCKMTTLKTYLLEILPLFTQADDHLCTVANLHYENRELVGISTTALVAAREPFDSTRIGDVTYREEYVRMRITSASQHTTTGKVFPVTAVAVAATNENSEAVKKFLQRLVIGILPTF